MPDRHHRRARAPRCKPAAARPTLGRPRNHRRNREDTRSRADEDEGDLLGVIESFDSTTGTLVITALGGYTLSGVVTGDTEIEFEEADGDESQEAEGFEDREATTADLVPGVKVAEMEFDDETGALEEIEIYQTVG